MRELSFKGYLQQQLCELSNHNSKSLYKFAGLAESNARLKNTLCLYLNYYVSEKLKKQLCKKYSYLKEECDRLNGVAVVYPAPKTAVARGLNRTLAAHLTAPPPLI